MASWKIKAQHKLWRREEYFISTDPSTVPLSCLSAVMASDVFYWADALPEDALRETLENSLCFGLYHCGHETDNPAATGQNRSSDDLVGFARCITDFTTFVYLTDVFVDPQLQGKGLGAWMMECVRETIDSMPYLRRSMLFTSDWERSVPFYRKTLGMGVVECSETSNGSGKRSAAVMQKLGCGFPRALLLSSSKIKEGGA